MSEQDIYFLTDKDRDVLKRMHRFFDNERVNLDSRTEYDKIQVAPEVYVVLTPTDGIPALTRSIGTTIVGTGTDKISGTSPNTTVLGDKPGSASCLVVQLVNGYFQKTLNDLSITVYNLSTAPVRGGMFICARRDKFGTWVADPQPLAIERGKPVANVSPGGSGTVFIYTGAFGSETATGRAVGNVYNPTACTIKANVMQTIQHVPDNNGWQFLVYKAT